MISKIYLTFLGQIFKPIDLYTSEKSLTTDVQTSIEKCRRSSNFNENLMKIHFKKSENPNVKILKIQSLGTDPGNK